MLTINTNLSSLIAQQSLKQSTNKLNTAIERMTTGFKINSAKDNAANYSISTNMTTKIGAYQVAEDNAAMGLDLIGTAEGTLSQIQDKLARLRALAEQAANGTYGEQSLNAINTEANAIVDEIERVYNNTEYNGINLMKGRVTGTEESKFIKDIDRRDTSKMKTMSSVDETEKLTHGTYSISTAEELAKLATMTNNGLVGEDTEFVLANDIDLQAWCDAHAAVGGWTPIGNNTNKFVADFDGNGYIVSNLTINNTLNNQGFWGCTQGAYIKNLGVVSLQLLANENVGMIGNSQTTKVENCFSAGNISAVSIASGIIARDHGGSNIDLCYSEAKVKGKRWMGGLMGKGYSSVVKNSFFSGEVEATLYHVGGLIAEVGSSIVMNNCYFSGKIVAPIGNNTHSGGLVGIINSGNKVSIFKNVFLYGEATNINSIFGKAFYDLKNEVIIEDCGYNESYAASSIPLVIKKNSSEIVTVKNFKTLSDGEKPLEISNKAKVCIRDSGVNLQIGINSDSASQIGVNTGYALDGLSILRNIGNGTNDYLSIIDEMLVNLSESTTTLGATSNRLESVLDEIQIQHDNLVSSRSTLRDADIAEVSAEYIQQQILQQASATLLATANQSPSIALQLI